MLYAHLHFVRYVVVLSCKIPARQLKRQREWWLYQQNNTFIQNGMKKPAAPLAGNKTCQYSVVYVKGRNASQKIYQIVWPKVCLSVRFTGWSAQTEFRNAAEQVFRTAFVDGVTQKTKACHMSQDGKNFNHNQSGVVVYGRILLSTVLRGCWVDPPPATL